jgi:ATP-binding cassette subfamily B protein
MTLVAASLVALVWWGAKSVFEGTVTAGELTQFMFYALMASNSLASISEIFGTLQTVAGATERLVEILETKAAIRWPEKPTPLPKQGARTCIPTTWRPPGDAGRADASRRPESLGLVHRFARP